MARLSGGVSGPSGGVPGIGAERPPALVLSETKEYSRRPSRPLWSALALALLAACGPNGSAERGTIEVERAHVAAPAGEEGPTAMYLTIHNGTPVEIALIAAEAEAAERTELHAQRVEEGRMRMERLDRIPISAREEVRMAPGGLHVMMMGLRQPLIPGDSVEVVLHFDSGDRVRTRAAVLSYGELAGIYEATGEQHRREGS